ncbi:MAG: hypothetical protein EAZ95_03410 [Bacteroidetes bacterium]|nr:MAG: hypothetical protein EAZ95_03410 [Bacteroidota bacterium]
MKRTNFVWATALAFTMIACGGEAPKQEEKEKPEPEPKEEAPKKEEPKPEALSEEGQKIAKKWAMKEFTHTDGKKEEVKGKQILHLKADGTFEQVFGEKTVATGTWNVKDKNLTMKHLTGAEKDQTEKLVVKEATDKKLVTVDDGGKMTETYEATE